MYGSVENLLELWEPFEEVNVCFPSVYIPEDLYLSTCLTNYYLLGSCRYHV